jgi:indolepyruvate ferredoxin oxidoreductase beta subunit
VKRDIVIAGVGGQGNIFFSRILSQYAMERGFQVLGTETIGAAQRGGSVVSHIRFSDQTLYSPLIPPGLADVALGMEPLELLRNMRMLSTEGYWILNRRRIPTVFTNLGIDRYPADEEIERALKQACPRGFILSATEEAVRLGDIQVTNVVLLGALAEVDGFFQPDEVEVILRQVTPARLLEKNVEAFAAGRRIVGRG